MEMILEEIWNIKELGYEGLWIGDDCFTLDREHVRAFCRCLIRENIEMKWSCLSRADEISARDVELMGQAGCRKVYLGLESADNGVLKIMNKKVTVEGAERTVHLFSRGAIETAGFFMVGYPGETYETIEKTFAWALSLPLDDISFSIPYPLPGTPLMRRVRGTDPGLDWNYENENKFLYQSEFDAEYLGRRIEETYAQFCANRQSSRL
jgi:anaerobic magnesium-protoporphyrin IX monomethyl ester cyclase